MGGAVGEAVDAAFRLGKDRGTTMADDCKAVGGGDREEEEEEEGEVTVSKLEATAWYIL